VIVVSSYSGQDAASQSLDLDLSTMLGPDRPPRPKSPSERDERRSKYQNHHHHHPAYERSQSLNDGEDELLRHDKDLVRTDERWSLTDDIVMSEHHIRDESMQPDSVNAADHQAVDTFYDACDISADTKRLSASACDTETLSDTVFVSEPAHGSAEPIHDIRPLCNGRVDRMTAENFRQPCPSPTSSSSSSWSSGLLVMLSAVLLAVVFVLCGLVVLAYVVLESEVDVTVVRSVRGLPEVCQFYRDQYLTWRRWIIGHSDKDVTHWQCLKHVTDSSQQHQTSSRSQKIGDVHRE